MRRLHLEKKGLRGLFIAESFTQNSKKSLLAGIVMRSDFLIDGFVFGKTTISGTDATDEILRMYEKLDRPDINYIMISGVIISLYNMIDISHMHSKLQVPIIGVTYHDSSGIEDAIRHHFPESAEQKIQSYRKLGNRKKITLKTNSDVYIRHEGCTVDETKRLLNELTLQGCIPEPLRAAQLLARTMLLD